MQRSGFIENTQPILSNVSTAARVLPESSSIISSIAPQDSGGVVPANPCSDSMLSPSTVQSKLKNLNPSYEQQGKEQLQGIENFLLQSIDNGSVDIVQSVQKVLRTMKLLDDNNKWVIEGIDNINIESMDKDTLKQFISKATQSLQHNDFLLYVLSKLPKNPDILTNRQDVKESTEDLFTNLIVKNYVIDQLTKVFENNPKMFQDAIKHWQSVRNDNKWEIVKSWPITDIPKILFFWVKLFSVEKPVGDVVQQKIEQNELPEDFCKFFLQLNIFEAQIVDHFYLGHRDNAHAAHILNQNPIDSETNPALGTHKPYIKDNEVLVTSPLPKLWADLYQVWNGTFVSFDKDFSWVGILAAPEVSGYQDNPGKYIVKRATQLYLNLISTSMEPLSGEDTVHYPEHDQIPWLKELGGYVSETAKVYEEMVNEAKKELPVNDATNTPHFT